MTVGFIIVISFSGPVTAEEKDTMQALVFVELQCMPVSLVVGAVVGVLGSLLTKAITKALHAGERAQVVMSTIVAIITGAVTGVLWDLFVLLGSAS